MPTPPAQAYSANLSKELLDAGKRASDTANTHLTFYQPWDIRHKWLAFKLADGSSDGILYDTKRDAVRHQSDEKLCAYFCFRNCLSGTTPREMAIFLKFNRDAYNAGFRLPDPDDVGGGPTVAMTSARFDHDYRRMRNVVDYLKGAVRDFKRQNPHWTPENDQ